MIPIPSTASLRSRADQAKGRRDAIRRALEDLLKEIQGLASEEELLVLVCAFLRTLIDQEVTQGVKAVEKLQTEGLQAVFDDQALEVKANIEILRGKVSVDLVTVQKTIGGDTIEGSPMDAFGGSVLTVESILLRIIVMVRRGLRPILLLDETLPAFDSNYIVNMAKFLSELCKKLGIDILVVTHNPALFDAATHSYNIAVRRGDESWFEKVQ